MAQFNEGTFEDVKAKVQVGHDKAEVEEQTEGHAVKFDTSTSAYLFDLAIQKNDDVEFKHGVLERHPHFHIKGYHPLPTFSFRFGTVNDDSLNDESEQPARLWAQRHFVAKEPYYVISASPHDMDASKKDRSQFYLGKLKESHGARCFTGLSCAKDKSTQNPTVSIIYDHDRIPGEHKMEVGLPLNFPGSSVDDPISSTLDDDFHKTRREGAQNSSPSTYPVMCYRQRDSDASVMGDESILQKFVIDGSACATQTSTKNFQLVLSRPARANMLPPSDDVPSPDTDEIDNTVLLQMGKLDENVFSCAFRGPFTFLQAFMICLSRFETKQAY